MADEAPPVASSDLQGALSTLSGSGSQALSNYQQDEANLDGVGKDIASIPQFDPQQEMAQGPQVNRQGFMSMAPLLIGLSTLGGKIAGLHPRVMLGATNGMMQGLIKGNQQAYEDAKQRYNDAYQRYMDKYKQQLQIYKEMQQVYKGQANSDLKALEIALRATGYQGKIDEEALKQWRWTQEMSLKTEDAHHRWQKWEQDNAVKWERTSEVKEKQSAKKAGNDQAIKNVLAQIETMQKSLKDSKFLAGGAGGIRRIGEWAASTAGFDTDDAAHRFQTSNNLFLAELPGVIEKMSSRTGKDQRQKLEQAADGLRTFTNNRIASEQLDVVKGILQQELGEPADTGLKRVTNDADYNALPAGTEYIAPDASVRTKRK